MLEKILQLSPISTRIRIRILYKFFWKKCEKKKQELKKIAIFIGFIYLPKFSRPHQWRIGSALKTGWQEVPSKITGRLSRSEFSLVFSETRVNMGLDPLDEWNAPHGGHFIYSTKSLVWQLDSNLQPTNQPSFLVVTVLKLNSVFQTLNVTI